MQLVGQMFQADDGIELRRIRRASPRRELPREVRAEGFPGHAPIPDPWLIPAASSSPIHDPNAREGARKLTVSLGGRGTWQSVRHRNLEIQRAHADGQRRFLRRFGKRRMRVADPRNVLRRRAEFHGDDAL
jgi:hypothetical protein